ncbi:hypothetical protein AB0L88_33015 [Saccharopolyspora shandongensis]|uniref:hypothetical protein n=1 Tax=Saccharopolyspora shandongensis TaxID=418495 RepID=UPI0034419564
MLLPSEAHGVRESPAADTQQKLWQLAAAGRDLPRELPPAYASSWADELAQTSLDSLPYGRRWWELESVTARLYWGVLLESGREDLQPLQKAMEAKSAVEFNQALDQLRIQKKMSFRDVEALTRVSKSTVHRVATNPRLPTEKSVRTLLIDGYRVSGKELDLWFWCRNRISRGEPPPPWYTPHRRPEPAPESTPDQEDDAGSQPTQEGDRTSWFSWFTRPAPSSEQDRRAGTGGQSASVLKHLACLPHVASRKALNRVSHWVSSPIGIITLIAVWGVLEVSIATSPVGGPILALAAALPSGVAVVVALLRRHRRRAVRRRSMQRALPQAAPARPEPRADEQFRLTIIDPWRSGGCDCAACQPEPCLVCGDRLGSAWKAVRVRERTRASFMAALDELGDPSRMT